MFKNLSFNFNWFLFNRSGLVKPDIQHVNCTNWIDIRRGAIPNTVEQITLDTDYAQKVKYSSYSTSVLFYNAIR